MTASLWGTAVLTASPPVVPLEMSQRYVLRPEGELPRRPSVPGAPTLRPLYPGDRDAALSGAVGGGLRAEEGRAARAQGGGASAVDLRGIQVAYSDPLEGNVVLLLWTETESNPGDVEVLVDEVSVGSVPSLPADQVPGTNGVRITGLAPISSVFRVQAGGTSSEAAHLVLDAQPFVDASSLSCQGGARDPGPPATCELVAAWQIPGAEPTVFAVRLDGDLVTEVAGGSRDLGLDGVVPGEHCIALTGFLANPDGTYRGAEVETCCGVSCVDLPCDPPSRLVPCQLGYGTGDEDGIVRLRWRNGEAPYAAGVLSYLDGILQGTLPGASEGAVFSGISLDAHRFGVAGDCGDDGLSAVVEATLEVLASTPHVDPVLGDISCLFDPGRGETTATWTSDHPSSSIDVHVLAGETLVYIGTVPGTTRTVTVTGTASASELVVLQFFSDFGGSCYGSRFLACLLPDKTYIQGVCNGTGSMPGISSAVFLLGYLFGGSAAPPCAKACDADGNLLITDAIYILGYLFLGGPAPDSWTDSNGDGTPDPTCSAAAPEDDCAASTTSCS